MGKSKLPESEGWQGPFEAYWTNRSWPGQEPNWSVLGVEGHFLLNDLLEVEAVALCTILNAVYTDGPEAGA